MFGGEPLGDTVQVAGQHRRHHGPNVDINAVYSPHHAFRSYVDETFAGANYRVHTLGTVKAMTFRDIGPQARVHMLAIPKGAYVSTYDFFRNGSGEEMKVLLTAINQIIVDNQAVGTGSFRFISNAGRDANQSQPHLHFHVVRGDNATPLGIPAISKQAYRTMKTFNINEILGQIDNETLVVFDIDATLAWVAGHTWPYPDVANLSLAEHNRTLTMWQALINQCSNTTTNPGAKFIALTARHMPANLAEGGHADLNALGLNASYAWVANFNPGATYRNGVLYANYTNKGTLLRQFLNAARPHYPFKKVLFIDDRMDNVTNVHDKLREAGSGIESSTSFWYQGAIHPGTNATIGWNFWPLQRPLCLARLEIFSGAWSLLRPSPIRMDCRAPLAMTTTQG
jgi:histidine triad (HIT) family protein